MTSKTMLRLFVPLLAASTVLAGCAKEKGGSAAPTSGACPGATATDLSGVAVSSGDHPKISNCTPFKVASTVVKVLSEGDGQPTKKGDRLTVDYIGVNGTDGKEFDSSYGKQPATLVISESKMPAGVLKALTGVKVGSKILAAVPPAEGYGSQGVASAGIGPTDTLLFYFDVKSAATVLARATGTAVPPKPGLPTVTLAATGQPGITIPKTTPPTTLVVQPLIKGSGPAVKSGQSITVHYTGQIWATGKTFDSSWGKEPVSFDIGVGKVIKGWDAGLVGQPVGSQVLLVIPPNDGYGAAGNPGGGIKGTDTLVFVVDILDAA